MMIKKLDNLVLNHKKVCDELDEKIKHVHTILAEKEIKLLEQLETLFDSKQEELAELQMDHENDKEPFKVKPEVFAFGLNNNNRSDYDKLCEEAFATLLGFCFYQVCVSAPLPLFNNVNKLWDDDKKRKHKY